MCSEGVEEPLNWLLLCAACHTGWHDRTVTIHRDIFTPEQWRWVSAHARPQWLNDWYPGRQLELPF